MRADLVHAEFPRLPFGVAASRTLGCEMVAPVGDSHVIELRGPCRVRGADQGMQCKRGGAVAARETLDERLDARGTEWTGHSGFAGVAGRGVAGSGMGTGVVRGGVVREGGVPTGAVPAAGAFFAESGLGSK